MRVLQVHRDYAPRNGGGGVARHIHGLALELAEQGVSVMVASHQAPEAADGTIVVAKVSPAQLFWQVRKADVVHLHGSRSIYTAIAALACIFARKPYVYTPHCYYPSPWGAKALAKFLWDSCVERAITRYAERSCALTLAWRDYMQTAFGAIPIIVVPNCVRLADLPAASHDVVLAGAPAILSVGRLDRVKRIDDLVRALTKPGLEHAVLHIVGRGPDASRIESVAHALAVADRVVFHGFVDDKHVAAMLRAASVFALASAVEGQPTVLMEALLRGCAVVASDIPGNRGVLEPLGLDSSFPMGDVDELAACLIKTASVPLGADIAERAALAFSWEKKASDLLTLYREALRAA